MLNNFVYIFSISEESGICNSTLEKLFDYLFVATFFLHDIRFYSFTSGVRIDALILYLSMSYSEFEVINNYVQ